MIKGSVANEKMQESKIERERKKSYLVPRSGLVEPLVKLLVQKSLLWEFLGLLEHIGLIPGLEPKEFLLWNHIGICQHLKLFDEL